MSGAHAHDASFVRTEMLPEQAPPATEAGAIKWLRENLFSSWFNAIMTIVAIWFIYWVASREAALALDPWFVPVDDAIVGLVDEVHHYSKKELEQ